MFLLNPIPASFQDGMRNETESHSHLELKARKAPGGQYHDLVLFVYLFGLCAGVHFPWYARGGQKTTFRSQSPPSTLLKQYLIVSDVLHIPDWLACKLLSTTTSGF